MELRKLVMMHAADWHRIQETFSSKRSRNALIKRWHTKLKNLSDSTAETKSNQQVLEEEKSPITDSTLIHNLDIEVFICDIQAELQKQPTREWVPSDDQRLKSLVLDSHLYDWDQLAKRLEVTQEEVKRYWEQRIYPVIKSQRKIAGALMWTGEEDQIILHAIQKLGYKWENLLDFLPGRSYFSLEARWKRISTRYLADKKNSLRYSSKHDIRHLNHCQRLREYKTILKLRKSAHQRLCEHNCRQGTDSDN